VLSKKEQVAASHASGHNQNQPFENVGESPAMAQGNSKGGLHTMAPSKCSVHSTVDMRNTIQERNNVRGGGQGGAERNPPGNFSQKIGEKKKKQRKTTIGGGLRKKCSTCHPVPSANQEKSNWPGQDIHTTEGQKNKVNAAQQAETAGHTPKGVQVVPGSMVN